ncbi:hypothetical protein [Streptomyces sp. NPDC005760]|uniref:hypothetical protein n=1 Tax=Streptomyces sp. NPDC005760 TaxID=3156718 RepID=UPI0033E0F076
MANTKNKRRQRGSIRPNGAGFQVRAHAGRDPLAYARLNLDRLELFVEHSNDGRAYNMTELGHL